MLRSRGNSVIMLISLIIKNERRVGVRLMLFLAKKQ